MLEKYSPGDESYTSRAFVIRYKDEVHQLNEAVHWRLTVPKVELLDGGVGVEHAVDAAAPPFCHELLRIEYELYCCQLVTNNENSDQDMHRNVDAFLPPEPVEYERVARQTLCVQHAASGMHEYFPVRFTKGFLTNIDSFVHCGVTAVRYNDICVDKIAMLPRLVGLSESKTEAETEFESDDALALWYGADRWEDGVSLSYGGSELQGDFYGVSITDANTASSTVDNNGSAAFSEGLSTKKPHSFITTTLVDGGSQQCDNHNGSGSAIYRTPKKEYGGRYSAGKAMAASLVKSSLRASAAAVGGRTPDRAEAASTPDTAVSDFEENSDYRGYVPGSAATAGYSDVGGPSPAANASARRLGGSKTARKVVNVVSTGAVEGTDRMKQIMKGSVGTTAADGEHPKEKFMGEHVLIIHKGLQSMMKASAERDPAKDKTQLQVLRAAAGAHRDSTSASGLHRHQIERLYHRFAAPLVANFNLLNSHVEALLAFNAKLEWLKLHGSQYQTRRKNGISPSRNNVSGPTFAASKEKQECLLASTGPAIIDELMRAESVLLIKRRLQQAFNSSNAQTMARWAMLWVSLPHMAGALKIKLEPEYAKRIKLFWRRQALVNICSIAAVTKPQQVFEGPPAIDSATTSAGRSIDSLSLPPPPGQTLGASSRGALLKDYYSSMVNNLVVFEHNLLTNGKVCQLCVHAAKSSSAAVESRETTEALTVSHRPILGHVHQCHLHLKSRYYGRGLSIFDHDVHKDPSLLPTFVIEQYAKEVQEVQTSNPQAASISEECYSSVRGGSFCNCEWAEGSNPDASLQQLDGVYSQLSLADDRLSDGVHADGAVVDFFQREIAGQKDIVSGNSDHEISSVVDACVDNPVVNLLLPRTPLVKLLEATEVIDEGWMARHLVVFEHGFCGHPGDMMLLRSVLALEFPKHTRFLSAACNAGEVKSSESIDVMGKRLSIEVLNYCRGNMPDLFVPESDTRISFIGHSAGGLIIRRCLQEVSMVPLLNKLHVYMSLASPHLGTLYAESQLIATGMWAMLKLKKAQTLKVRRFVQ